MSRPITWQTLIGPSSADAMRGIEAARQGIGDAFGQIGQVIQQRQALQKEASDLAKAKATESAMGSLYAIATPEAFAEAQRTGALARMGQGTGVDQATFRKAVDGRLAELQNRARENISYGNAVANQATVELDRKEAPTIDQIKGLLAKGDKPSMSEAARLATTLSPRGYANAQGLVDVRGTQLTERERAEQRFQWDKDTADHRKRLNPLEIKSREASIRASNAATNASVQATNVSKNEEKFRDEERAAATERAKLDLAMRDNMYAEGIFDAKHIPALLADWAKVGSGADPDEIAQVAQRLQRLATEGIKRSAKHGSVTLDKLPLSRVRAALLGSTDQFWRYNEGHANTMEDNLRNALTGIRISGERGQAQQEIAEDLTTKQLQEYLELSAGRALATARGKGK